MSAEFKVTDLQYKIETDLGNFTVNETYHPIKVRYEGPFFYCDASVQSIIPDGETWYVGFIQTCDAITLRHSYASGNYTQWEFPTPISDSTTSSFPYYSLGKPVVSGRRNQPDPGARKQTGPKTKTDNYVRGLSMNDNLCSNVQWWDPVPDGQTNHDPSFPHTLTKIERKQKFSTYLVASQQIPKKPDVKHQVLAKVIWRMDMAIDFDCSQPLGSRATKSFGEGHTILYRTRDGSGLRLPPCAFVNTNANAAQKLVGYDSNDAKTKPHIPW